MTNKHPLSLVVPLISLLLFAVMGCGRNAAPQKTPEPVVVEKHHRDTIYLTDKDLATGDDCSQAITALHKTNSLLDKCEKDVNGLLDDNAELKQKLEDSGKKVKIRNSYNTKDSYNQTEINNLKKANQVLAQENSTLNAENAKLAGKLKEKPKEVIKKVGNTKEGKDRFWLGVLMASAVFTAIKHGKKFALMIPPPFGNILHTVLNFIA
jgi:hypothetical protein